MDEPGKVANPARGQLNRENEYFSVPVRAWEFRRVHEMMLEGTLSVVRLPYSGTNNRRHITHRAHVFIRLCLMEPFLLFFWHTTSEH